MENAYYEKLCMDFKTYLFFWHHKKPTFELHFSYKLSEDPSSPASFWLSVLNQE